MARSFSEIKSKVERGKAVVLTAQEVRDWVESGKHIALEDVDVVTCATRAVMSGTYAVFSFPVARPHAFRRAENAWLNGVPAQAGLCRNGRRPPAGAPLPRPLSHRCRTHPFERASHREPVVEPLGRPKYGPDMPHQIASFLFSTTLIASIAVVG